MRYSKNKRFKTQYSKIILRISKDHRLSYVKSQYSGFIKLIFDTHCCFSYMDKKENKTYIQSVRLLFSKLKNVLKLKGFLAEPSSRYGKKLKLETITLVRMMSIQEFCR